MKGNLLSGKKAGTFLLNNMVPIVFIVIGGIAISFDLDVLKIYEDLSIKSIETGVKKHIGSWCIFHLTL